MKQNQNNLNSVEKALKILMAFEAEHPAWGVRELSARLGFSPATVQRLFQTLKASGFVDQDAQTRQYILGNVYYRFLHTLQTNQPVTRAALPFMQKLLAATQETVHLNMIQGKERICIDHIESPKDLKATMPIGNCSPLYAGASSKCLLAFSSQDFIRNYMETVEFNPLTRHTIIDVESLRVELENIRAKGYAVSLGERSLGLGSISAPVLDHRGQVLVAISLAVPEIRYADESHRKLCVDALLRITNEFSEVMGYNNKN